MSRPSRQMVDLGEVVGVLEYYTGVKELIGNGTTCTYVRTYTGVPEEETEQEFQKKARNYPLSLMLIQPATSGEEANSFTVYGEEGLRKLSEFLAARFAEADKPAAGEAPKAQALLAAKIVNSIIGYLCISKVANWERALTGIKESRWQLERLTIQNLSEEEE